MIGFVAALLVAAPGDGGAVALRYDLRPGDRIVYKETLRREGTGSDFDYETRGEWSNQLAVTGSAGGRSLVGFQRNRISFDLVRYREKGKDRTREERDSFTGRLPPPRLAEANRVGEAGAADLPWSALRESSSELLPILHEVELVPAGRVRIGDEWKRWGPFGLDLRAAALEDVGGNPCLRLEGKKAPSDLRLRVWFGLESGIVERLEFEGTYATVGTRIRETLTLERVERRRSEDPLSWLDDPEVRQGALAAFLIPGTPPIDTARIDALLRVDDGPFQRQLHAYAIRRRLPAPASRFPEEPPGTTLRGMTTSGFEGWPYVVHVPDDYRSDQPTPVLISLSGGPGRALLGMPGARDEIQRHGWLVVFPQAQDLWWSAKSASIVSTLLGEVLRHFNVDTNRVYLSGSSNGGTGTFLYATLWPHRLAAAVSLMGAGTTLEVGGALPANLNGLPLLLAHGDKDEIIPIEASEETLKAVRRDAPRALVELKKLPGRGHEIFLGNDDGLVAGFLEGRVRDPFPRRVTVEMRDLLFPRRYWVEVLAKDGGLARVDGEIDDHNHVSLKTRNVKRLRLLLRRELLPGDESVRVTWNAKEAFTRAFAADPDLLAQSGRDAADPFLGWSMEIPLGTER